MSDTPNYDYLKPVLGEELFGQFAERISEYVDRTGRVYSL